MRQTSRRHAERGGGFNREYETNVRQHFDRDYRPDPARDRDFYESDLYNDSRFYGNRRGR